MQWTTGRVSWSSKLPMREVLLQGGVNLFQGSSPPLRGGWINPWNSRMREVVGAMRGGAQRYREVCVNKSQSAQRGRKHVFTPRSRYAACHRNGTHCHEALLAIAGTQCVQCSYTVPHRSAPYSHGLRDRYRGPWYIAHCLYIESRAGASVRLSASVVKHNGQRSSYCCFDLFQVFSLNNVVNYTMSVVWN